MKKICIVVAFTLPLLTLTDGCRRKAEQFRNAQVSGGELRSPLQAMFAHTGTEYYLTVRDRTYTNVRGTKPFYLKIPQLHSILFVTGKVDHEGVFHLVDLNTGQVTTINGAPEDFGWEIGSSRNPGDPWTDYVADASSNKLILIHQYPETRREIILNLKSKTIERIETKK